MLQSIVMLYSKSTKHKLVVMQKQAFEWENQWSKLRDSSRWPRNPDLYLHWTSGSIVHLVVGVYQSTGKVPTELY